MSCIYSDVNSSTYNPDRINQCDGCILECADRIGQRWQSDTDNVVEELKHYLEITSKDERLSVRCQLGIQLIAQRLAQAYSVETAKQIAFIEGFACGADWQKHSKNRI